MSDTEKIINSTFDSICKINPCPPSTYKIFIDFMSYIYDKNDENIKKMIKEKMRNLEFIDIGNGETFRCAIRNPSSLNGRSY